MSLDERLRRELHTANIGHIPVQADRDGVLARHAAPRRRRPARRMAAVAATIVILAAAVLALNAARGSKGTELQTAERPAPTPGKPEPMASTLPAGPVVPADWRRVTYDTVELAVPPDWAVIDETAPALCSPTETSSPSKVLALGRRRLDTVPCPSTPASLIRVSTLTATNPGATNTTINGIAVNTFTPSVVDLTVHEIPALGVEIQTSGPDTAAVLNTLTYSTQYRVLHTVAPVPDGWRSVTYQGLRFEVPADWPVNDISGSQSAANPGLCNTPYFTTPALVLGVSNAGVPSCPYTPPQIGVPPTDGLWLFAPGQEAPTGTPAARHQQGIEIVFLPDDPTQPRIAFSIQNSAGQRIGGVLGTGADANVAAAVLGSFRPA